MNKVLKAVTEKDFLAKVREMATLLGWRTYHTHRSDRSEAGFPDLVMVRGKRLIFAELKTMKGKVDREQHAWLNALRPVAEVYLWRPDQGNEIEERLKEN